MAKLTFTTTGCWDNATGFGCASLGLPGICPNDIPMVATYENDLKGTILTGNYAQILQDATAVTAPVYAAIVVFGNAGGENEFLKKLQALFPCPMVGGGAAIDGATGRSSLIPGGGEGAVFLITDDRYTFTAQTRNIHTEIIEECALTYSDKRTVLTINGMSAAAYLKEKKAALNLPETDFEHLTLSDLRGVNAHLSSVDGMIKSGRDVCNKMLLRYVPHQNVYDEMARFYDDPDAIVFGCAGLSGLLDRPLNPPSLGLFLFGEVCTVDGVAEFGNLMLSKLVIKKK